VTLMRGMNILKLPCIEAWGERLMQDARICRFLRSYKRHTPLHDDATSCPDYLLARSFELKVAALTWVSDITDI
jgi:hypothetical protein